MLRFVFLSQCSVGLFICSVRTRGRHGVACLVLFVFGSGRIWGFSEEDIRKCIGSNMWLFVVWKCMRIGSVYDECLFVL